MSEVAFTDRRRRRQSDDLSGKETNKSTALTVLAEEFLSCHLRFRCGNTDCSSVLIVRCFFELWDDYRVAETTMTCGY